MLLYKAKARFFLEAGFLLGRERGTAGIVIPLARAKRITAAA